MSLSRLHRNKKIHSYFGLILQETPLLLCWSKKIYIKVSQAETYLFLGDFYVCGFMALGIWVYLWFGVSAT